VADFYRPAQGTAYDALSVGQKTVIDAQAVNYAKPADGTSYTSLSAEQQAILATYYVPLDYSTIASSVWDLNYDNIYGKLSINDFGPLYQFADMSGLWGDANVPESGTAFADLTTAQKQAVASHYRPLTGTAYADLTPAQKALVDSYANPADYGMPDLDTPYQNLSAAQKSVVANALRPAAGTAYADLSDAQQAVVQASLDFVPAAGPPSPI
jgi:hypothetical protein